MRKITFSEATREAMAEEMEKYPECFVMGEDIARQGGIFGQFKGLPAEFPGRVIDTPISETFIVGGGVESPWSCALPTVWPAAAPPSTPRAWRAGSSTSPASRSWLPPIPTTPRWS